MRSAEPRRIPRVTGLCAEQIQRRGSSRHDTAVLVDQFGRAHPLAASTIVGREPGATGLAVVEASVSRRHAELRAGDTGWKLRDLDSTNGTFLDGRRVRELQPITDGQLIVVGDVGLLFYENGASASAIRDTESIRATAASPTVVAATLRLSEPTGGGGGYAEFRGQQVQLGAAQFALLAILAQRLLAEQTAPQEVRGFVRSSELLAELPWNTPYPGDNHLKQLVRRVRRALERIGLADVVESRQRLGYRLVIVPIFEP